MNQRTGSLKIYLTVVMMMLFYMGNFHHHRENHICLAWEHVVYTHSCATGHPCHQEKVPGHRTCESRTDCCSGHWTGLKEVSQFKIFKLLKATILLTFPLQGLLLFHKRQASLRKWLSLLWTAPPLTGCGLRAPPF